MEDILSLLTSPTVTQFSGAALLGAIIGYATGFTLKKVFKLALIIVGLSFILIQGLQYLGIVTVSWTFAESLLPALTPDNLQNTFNQLLSILLKNVPGSSGFSIGILLGIKRA